MPNNKEHKIRGLTLLIILLNVMFFSGCAMATNYLENEIIKEAGISVDTDYQSYQQMYEANELDDSGYYRIPVEKKEVGSDENRDGVIHVTFASNRYLQIKYYKDQTNKQAINVEDCYMNPGDSIYAKVESKNPNSNLYEIAQYRIYDYSDDEVTLLSNSLSDTNFVYQIPFDYLGTDLCIVPIGQYIDRILNMEAFYIDSTGRETLLSNAGTWFINGEKCNESTSSVNPIKSYVLKFDYDDDNFFFVRSTPESFTETPDIAGFVEFWKAEPTSTNADYRVQLHPYINLTIKLGEKGTICINDGDKEEIKKGKLWTNNKLKYGDHITIETQGDCFLVEGDFNHVESTKDPLANGSRYTLTITEKGSQNGNEVVNVNEYITVTLEENCKYGSCSYKLDGKVVSGIIDLQLNQKLQLTYTITEKGYKFAKASILNMGQDLIGNMKQTITIPLSIDLNNDTIHPDDWFDIIEK